MAGVVFRCLQFLLGKAQFLIDCLGPLVALVGGGLERLCSVLALVELCRLGSCLVTQGSVLLLEFMLFLHELNVVVFRFYEQLGRLLFFLLRVREHLG